jgi:hypothetical protein
MNDVGATQHTPMMLQYLRVNIVANKQRRALSPSPADGTRTQHRRESPKDPWIAPARKHAGAIIGGRLAKAGLP